jgi:hypothetical protein
MVTEQANHDARIGRVESEMGGLRQEVGTLTTDMVGLKSDVKGLGGILGRIEEGVLRAQQKSEEKESASRPNFIAVISILITIISIIVGGAWAISGQLSRMDERDLQRNRELDLITKARDREFDRQEREVKRLEDRMANK